MEHRFFNRNSSESKTEDDHQVTYINGLGFLPETPQQTEHKQLVVQYNVLLFSILLLFFLRVVSFAPIANFLALLGCNITINPLTNLVTMSAVSAQLVNIVAMSLYMGVPALIILVLGRRYFRCKQIFAPPNYKTTRHGIPIVLGVSVLASVSSKLFCDVMEWSGLVILRNQSEPPAQVGAFVLYFFSMTLLPAFLEELLFRGAILQSLRRFGDMIAIIVSTVLYALVQPSFDQAIFSFVMGLVLGYFALKSGSIVASMAGSFVIKAMGCMETILGAYLSPGQLLRAEWITAFLMLGASLIAFGCIVKTDKKAFQLYRRDTYLTNRTKIKLLLTNLGFWMIVVLAFLYMIPYVQIIG